MSLINLAAPCRTQVWRSSNVFWTAHRGFGNGADGGSAMETRPARRGAGMRQWGGTKCRCRRPQADRPGAGSRLAISCLDNHEVRSPSERRQESREQAMLLSVRYDGQRHFPPLWHRTVHGHGVNWMPRLTEESPYGVLELQSHLRVSTCICPDWVVAADCRPVASKQCADSDEPASCFSCPPANTIRVPWCPVESGGGVDGLYRPL